MKRISLFALLFLGGCYASAEPLFLPDGSSGYRLSCGDYFGTMADCIEKAGDMCGANGYQMYDQAGKPLSAEAQNQTVIAALNSSVRRDSRSTDDQKNMFIKCKTTDAPLHLMPAPTPRVETTPAPLLTTPALPNNGPVPLK